MFVWPTAYRFFSEPAPGPLFPKFTNHLVTSNFWETFPSVAVAIPFLLICGFLTVYFLGQKGFCTYACPYGGFFGLADKLSPGKIRVTDACNQCGHCTATCTSNVLVHAEVKEYEMVVDPGCMKCMDCISVCPNDALYFGFGKPTVAVPKSKPIPSELLVNLAGRNPRSVRLSGKFSGGSRRLRACPISDGTGLRRGHDVSRSEDLEIAQRNECFFHRFNLEVLGKNSNSGMGISSFLDFLGWLDRAQWLGSLSRIRRRPGLSENPDSRRAGAGPDKSRSLAQPGRSREHPRGKKHLQAASRFRIVRQQRGALRSSPGSNIFPATRSDPSRCSARRQPTKKGRPKRLSLYYRGTILNRLGRYEQARTSLDAALAERRDLILARQEKGESLWQLGRKEEAITVWTDAVRRNANPRFSQQSTRRRQAIAGPSRRSRCHEKQADQFTPDDPLYHWMLGLRLKNLGMIELAEKHFQRAIQLDPELQSVSK